MHTVPACSVVSAKCSLDRGLLALQRSDVLLEMVDLSTGNISVHTRSIEHMTCCAHETAQGLPAAMYTIIGVADAASSTAMFGL
jgi:hypothetical protein